VIISGTWVFPFPPFVCLAVAFSPATYSFSLHCMIAATVASERSMYTGSYSRWILPRYSFTIPPSYSYSQLLHFFPLGLHNMHVLL